MSHVQAFGRTVLLWAPAAVVLSACVQPPSISYRTQVEPILQGHCRECHSVKGEGYKKSGFSVDSYDHVMRGTKFGAVIVPGSAVSSTLYRLVAGEVDPSIRMPHKKKPLSEYDVKVIKTWINQGAKNI